MSYYFGVNRQGRSVLGCTPTNPGDFIESKFRAGWRELKVTLVNDPNAEEVGGICRHLDTHQRIWWAER